MHILIVSATLFEIKPFFDRLGPADKESEHLYRYRIGEHALDVLVPGVGMVATAFQMGKRLAAGKVDAAINAGIAGSFRTDLPIGEVVRVEEDCVPEMASEEDGRLVSFFELGLLDPWEHPYRSGRLVNDHPLSVPALESLRKVTGNTVNTLRDREASLKAGMAFPPADIETMEGAAFLYACLSAGIPCVQLRAVSNFVGERDKTKWNAAAAVRNLNKTLKKAVMELTN